VSSLTTSWEGSGAVVNGVYYDWGYNRTGQLGDGSTVDSNIPVRVKLPAPVAEVFQGGDYAADGETMALLTNGKVYAWGTNTRGELDVGNTTNHLVPVPVPALTGASEVVCGGQTCYALLSGHLYGFGSSANGVLQKNGRSFTYVTATSSNVAAIR
jgi:alpha-tubulin suppressor-like RCC1 family protein